MKGMYHVIVQNKRLRYEFDIKRNITIIRGDSATGKTTLYEMISLAARMGDSSGIEVQCERKCRTLEELDWELVLPSLHELIIFLDEDNHFLKTVEFARLVKQSDNYFVIITREDLPNLPYSVEEIYGIHTAGKYHDMKRIYNEFYHIYSNKELTGTVRPEAVLVEDSNAGYEFFESICSKSGIVCKSAEGKSNIKDKLKTMEFEAVAVIADGAAIGSEINELYQYMKVHSRTVCYLPESFEWLILKSGLIDGNTVQNILEHPYDFIESQEYLSWERFFTALLVHDTNETYLHYNKHKLNDAYLHEKSKKAILGVIDALTFESLSLQSRSER